MFAQLSLWGLYIDFHSFVQPNEIYKRYKYTSKESECVNRKKLFSVYIGELECWYMLKTLNVIF